VGKRKPQLLKCWAWPLARCSGVALPKFSNVMRRAALTTSTKRRRILFFPKAKINLVGRKEKEKEKEKKKAT